MTAARARDDGDAPAHDRGTALSLPTLQGLFHRHLITSREVTMHTSKQTLVLASGDDAAVIPVAARWLYPVAAALLSPLTAATATR